MLPIDPLLSFRPLGIRVTVNLSTLIVICLMAGGVTVGLEPGSNPSRWVIGTGAVIGGVFAAVALQVVGELIAYRRLRGTVRRIHLLSFGGIFVLSGDEDSPRRESIAGLAGMVPLLLVATCVAVGLVAVGRQIPGEHTLSGAVVAIGAIATLQAMPGLGLAGGRVLRGIVWYLTDNALSGARITALYAHIIGAGLMTLGLGIIGLGGARPYWGIWAILAGWQLSGAARIEVYRTRWLTLTSVRTIAEILLPTTRVAGSAMIDTAIDLLLSAGSDSPLLVIGDDGHPSGLLRFDDLRRVRRSEWGERTVASVATTIDTLPHLPSDARVIEALDALDQADATMIVVTAPGEPDRRIAAIARSTLSGRLHDRTAG